jgi:biopolymer transport protein ExbD
MSRPDWDDRPELDTPENVELNLTSLIDVVLVLLIVFMVSAGVYVESGRADAGTQVELQLPSGSSVTDQPPKSEMVVQINADGLLFQNGAATEWRSMTKELADRLGREPDLQVRVEADERLSYSKVMETILELQSLGVRNIGLGTRSQQP